jgi:hypothetical protein
VTRQRNLKRLVRDRMARTGMRYASARRSVLLELDGAASGAGGSDGFLHLPGFHPECTALRVLLANAGVVAPHTGEAPSEELVLGIAGGVGTGVMSFRYEREDLSNFWLTGWNPFQSSVIDACGRLGARPAPPEAASGRGPAGPAITETAGARAAERQLGELLAAGVPAMAWVDLAELGYAGLPQAFAGGAYHTVVVYRAEPGGAALLGDRAPSAIEVEAERLARARARIRKHRNRLLSLGADELDLDLAAAVRRGLEACAAGPTGGPEGAMSIQGVRAWADRVQGGGGKGSWARVFPRGRHLWGALGNVYRYVEHDGSGGGLLRPAYARFLREAATLVEEPRLEGLAGRYDALGERWRAIAATALPDDVPALRATRELVARTTEPFLRHGPAAEAEIRSAWQALDALGEEMDERFPLDEHDTDALLARLKARLSEVYEEEVATLGALARLARSP